MKERKCAMLFSGALIGLVVIGMLSSSARAEQAAPQTEKTETEAVETPCDKTIDQVQRDVYAGAPEKTTQPCPACLPGEEAIEDSAENWLPKIVDHGFHTVTPPKKEWEKFKWGLEERIRQEYVKNATTLTKDETNRNYFRFRTKLWMEATPHEWLKAYVRLGNEFRAWMAPNLNSDLNEVFFDNLYVESVRPFELPVSMKVGRQDITYGNGFIFLEGTPLDGSRSVYFDAIKGTVHVDALKTDIDGLVIECNRMDRKFFKFNPSDQALNSDEIQAYGYYLTSKIFGDPLTIEQYYIYKDGHGQPWPASTFSNNSKINTWGARLSGKPIENFKYETELAVQSGKQGPTEKSGLGGYVIGTYNFPVKCKPTLSTGYYYLSGDDPDTNKREDWDPMFSRSTYYGDLLLFLFGREGGIAYWNNLHTIQVSGSICPVSWWHSALSYNKLWADENPLVGTAGFSTGRDRGDLVRWMNKFNLTKNVSTLFQLELFDPNDYYVSEAEDALFMRWEILIKY
jgi:hypothetical protein